MEGKKNMAYGKAIKFLEEANKELAQQINYKKKIVNAVDKK